MTAFTLHDETSAPEASKPLLAKSKAEFGMIPNLHAVLAEAPSVLEAYQVLHELFQQSDLDKEEITVIWQTINIENVCIYCVPAHTAVAKRMGVEPAVIEALRNQTPLPTARLGALRTFTLAVVRARGQFDPAALEAFLAAGYSKRNALEVILGFSHKVMSNYTNHLAKTPLDAPFKKFDWAPGDQAA
ncbi:MAG: carboxymuconolactone decarboxylase family protein [Pseudomonadota bacterium]